MAYDYITEPEVFFDPALEFRDFENTHSQWDATASKWSYASYGASLGGAMPRRRDIEKTNPYYRLPKLEQLPADTLMLVDASHAVYRKLDPPRMGCSWIYVPQDNNSELATLRHSSGSVNYAAVDGHVQSVPSTDLGWITPNAYQQEGVTPWDRSNYNFGDSPWNLGNPAIRF